MNMGAGINTAADDLAPFIHADNQTLYFTSGGHPGYGGSDIYLIRRQPDGEWGKPENLGFPINTTDDDGSLIVAANGKTAYFASARTDSRGGLDLYRFELPEYARALKTQWEKGLPSAITLTSLQDSSWTERVVTDETGRYLITLPVGRSYSLTVSRQGYLYYSDAFNLEGNPTDSNYRKDIPLEPIQINASRTLKNILFETNSFRLSSTSFVELDKLVALLLENKSLNIEIGGHTDNVGNLADNLKLSTNRAKAVVDYLVLKGIDLNKLSFKGYGSTRPLTENDTEDGRAKNRRTEIKVTGF
jgi:outer membrane protein OmpA-like peptidoglycan-associated protein